MAAIMLSCFYWDKYRKESNVYFFGSRRHVVAVGKARPRVQIYTRSNQESIPGSTEVQSGNVGQV